MLGSRWGVRTVSPVSCCQENYNIPRTKDHSVPEIHTHRNTLVFQRKNVRIPSGWVAEFPKSFFCCCFLSGRMLSIAAPGAGQMWYCGTKIPCLWSRMVVPFPHVEKYFTASGVLGAPVEEACSLFHSLKGQLNIFTVYPGWEGGSDECFLSAEQPNETALVTLGDLSSLLAFLNHRDRHPARNVYCLCPWVWYLCTV